MRKLKQFIVIYLLIFVSLASISQARFFIGIDAGYSMDRVDTETKPTRDAHNKIIKYGTFTKNALKGNGYLFNLNLGTQHYFDKKEMFGFRWLINIAYGRTDLFDQINQGIHYPSGIIDVTVGFDFLFDLIKFGNHSLGFFGGVEGGVNAFLSDKFYINSYDGVKFDYSGGSISLTSRIGFSLFLAQQHRIEFIAKIPVYEITGNENSYHPIRFMLGYKFVF